MRSVAQTISYEMVIALIVFIVVILFGTLSFQKYLEVQVKSIGVGFLLPLFIFFLFVAWRRVGGLLLTCRWGDLSWCLGSILSMVV